MRVAICGPLHVPALRHLFDDGAAELRGHGGHCVTELTLDLHALGLELDLVSLDPMAARVTRLQGDGVTLTLCPMRARHRARDFFREERHALQAALDAVPSDLVHAHWTYEYALAPLDAKRLTVVTVHDWGPTVLRYQPTPYRAVRLAMQARVLRRARHLVVTSPYMEAKVQRVSKGEVALLPNALSPSWPRHPPRRESRGMAPRLVAVMNGFGRLKNARALIGAFAQVRRSCPAATLELIGEDYEEAGPAHRWASGARLEDGVTFRGPIPRDLLPEAIGNADLFVHPSREESFGMVLVEAMALSLPVLGGRHSGAVPWVLDEGRAGALADVRSQRALADAICALLADVTERRRLAAAGFEHVRSHFDGPDIARQHVELYERVLGGRAR